MPYNEPDPEDPNMLVGMALPASAESDREMAWCFAEEFARMGFTRERLMGLFTNPFYAGAFRALKALGQTEIQRIVDECAAFQEALNTQRKGGAFGQS